MFLPDNIDLKKPEKYVLTVRIKQDGFSFLIADPQDASVFCFQEKDFIKEQSVLNNIQGIILDFYKYLPETEYFGKTNVVIVSEDYELVPSIFDSKQCVKKFYSFTHMSNKDEQYVLVNENAINGCHLVFGINSDLYLFLKRSLVNPRFFHYNGLLINYFRKKAAACATNSMFVHFHENFVELNCFSASNNILFSRTYHSEHYQDIVYHILGVWEKSGFNQMEDSLFLYGYSHDYHQIEVVLKDYIKSVRDNGFFEQLADFREKAQSVPLDLLLLPA
jgi:hypothetical protein